MQRFIRWTAILIGALVVLLIIAYAALHVLSARKLDQTFPIPKVSIVVPTDDASIAEGKRLATIRGCFGGCHGTGAEGKLMFDKPAIARIVAPNLTAAVRKYSDHQLA